MAAEYIFYKGPNTGAETCRGRRYAKKLLKILKVQKVSGFKYKELASFEESTWDTPIIRITF